MPFDPFLGHAIQRFFAYITQIFDDIPTKRCNKAAITCDKATTRIRCDIGGVI